MVGEDARKPEVYKLHTGSVRVVVEEDVLGFQVSVYDASRREE